MWNPIFRSFYFLKYEIFIKTLELYYKIEFPFTADGKDFNSANVKEAFRIRNDKITLEKYLEFADFYSLGKTIQMLCSERNENNVFTNNKYI